MKLRSEYVFWTQFTLIAAGIVASFIALHHYQYSILLWFMRNPSDSYEYLELF